MSGTTSSYPTLGVRVSKILPCPYYPDIARNIMRQIFRHKSTVIRYLEILENRGVAGGPGFEPGLTESESVVLPLDDPPFSGPLASF